MKNDRIAMYLAEIQYSILDIEKYLTNVTKEEFCSSSLLVRASTQALSQIGEACHNLLSKHPEFIEKYPNMDWRGLYSFRNKVNHGYDDLLPEKVFENIEAYFAILKTEFEKILENEKELKELVTIGVEIYIRKYSKNDTIS